MTDHPIDHTPPALRALGWNPHFQHAFDHLPTGRWAPARVTAQHRGRYKVAGEHGEHAAVLAGRLRHAAASRDELPATGDWVAVSSADDGAASIHAVLPRQSAFRRKVAGAATEAQVVAANVDVALIAAALPGDVNERRMERYLALAWESGAVPVVVLTKADLSHDIAADVRAIRVAAPGADVVAVSCVTGRGIDELARLLKPGRTAVLLGSSGAGKSTLANHLAGADALRTGAVRADGKGRHTTTHRELVRLAGGALLIDTPGMRELQLWSADEGIGGAFPEIDGRAAQCRFGDCGHEAEPGCAVLAAVASGDVDGERLASWRKLRREMLHLQARQDEALAARERAHVRATHRALRSRLKQKYG